MSNSSPESNIWWKLVNPILDQLLKSNRQSLDLVQGIHHPVLDLKSLMDWIE